MQVHALIKSRARFSRALFSLGLILSSCVSAREAAAEIIVKTDSLPPPSSFQLIGLSSNVSRIANLLTAPVDGNIIGVQILWGSLTGNATPSQQVAIHVSSANPNGDPWTPVSTLATIGSPVLADGAINEFRFLDPTTNLIPLSVPITAGTKFFVDLELVPSSADGPDVAGLLLDANGTQGENSYYLLRSARWVPLAIGIPGGGDVGIRAIIQPVPEPSTYVLAATGIVALLTIKRRKAFRFSRALLLIGLILFSCVSARETAAEIIAKVDSLPPAWTENRLVGLGPTISRIDQLLESPVDGEIVGVQVFWESLTGTAAPVQQPAIRVSSRSGQTGLPETTLATINSPTLYDVGLNEFRFLDPEANLIPISVPVTAGQKFFIGLELIPSAANSPDTPGLMMDSDRIQGQNFAQTSNGAWVFLTIGIFHGGDLGLRAIIQPVPEPSTYALAAIGAIGLLAINRRKAFRFSRALLVVGLVLFSCVSALAETYQVQIALDDSSLHIPRSYILNRHTGQVSALSPGVFNPWFLGNTGSIDEEVFVFALPVLGAGESIDSASFRFSATSQGVLFNVDLYGIGINNSGTPLAEFLDSDIPDAGNVRLQDNLLTPLSTADANVVRTTDASGGAALAAYLNSFYSDNSGYAGGSYVYLRINPDGAESPNPESGLWRIWLSGFSGPNGVNDPLEPVLSFTTVPEPSTCALAAIGVVGLLAARRRKNSA